MITLYYIIGLCTTCIFTHSSAMCLIATWILLKRIYHGKMSARVPMPISILNDHDLPLFCCVWVRGVYFCLINAWAFAFYTCLPACMCSGWQLGEHAEWGKYTNFEYATRVPFFIRVPGMSTAGQTTSALVEYVDLLPTLAEATGECIWHWDSAKMCAVVDRRSF